MKFSIRDLLWLTVIVALVLGWWVDHRRQAIAIEQLDSPFRDLEGGNYRIVPMSGKDTTIYLLDRQRHLLTVRRESSAPAPNPPKP